MFVDEVVIRFSDDVYTAAHNVNGEDLEGTGESIADALRDLANEIDGATKF